MRKGFLLGIIWLVVSVSVQAQTSSATGPLPSYEVVSIKPNKSGLA